MNLKLKNLLQSHSVYDDRIYSSPIATLQYQVVEKALRERVAETQYDNYLDAISCSHSLAVMDHEVDRFLAKIQQGRLILDIGGILSQCAGAYQSCQAHAR
jgi:hypothetical protein